MLRRAKGRLRVLRRQVRTAASKLLRASRVPIRASASKRVPEDDVHRLWLDRDDVIGWHEKDAFWVARRAYPRPWDMAEANREVVTRILDEAGVRYFDVGGSGVLRSILAVPEVDWPAAVDAFAKLRGADIPDPTYMDVVTDGLQSTSLVGSERADITAGCTELRLYHLQRYAEQEEARGFEARCQVQKWCVSEADDAVYVSPTSNDVAASVAESMLNTREVTEWGRTRRRLEGILPSPLTPSEPIDVVYMWVDGSDPEWFSRMLDAKGEDVDAHSYDPSRFRDRGELRHSIRSLLVNAPWIRHVYLVTDRQVPAWLNTDSKRITVVDHREIFSEKAVLPTFNSHAIGSRLHHIAGLSERYVVMNDDVFLNRPVAPDLFFSGTAGVVVPLARTLAPILPREKQSPIESARRNSASLVERDYERTPRHLFRHTPVPQLKSLMSELEDRYSDVFSALERSQFRSHDDYEVNSWLHHYVAMMTGRGVVGRHNYSYINLASDDGRELLLSLRPTSRVLTFCINDVGDGERGDDSEFLERWLSEYFPEPSEVELPGV